MATYLDIAKLIPNEFRTVILLNNYIYKAVPDFDDFDMMQLWFYWANLIEPDNSFYKYRIEGKKIVVDNGEHCRRCLGDLHDKWKLLEPYLVYLEKEYNLTH